MTFLRRYLMSRAAKAKAEAQAKAKAEAQSQVGAAPAAEQALVFYAVDGPDGAITAQTPSLVILNFDPVDCAAAFPLAADGGPGRAAGGAVGDRLTAAVAAPRRDPNSRGRVEQVRRWVADGDVQALCWRLEPAATAGAGA